MELARHRHAKRWLAAVSFAESSVFPIPPDIMLLPMVLSDRAAWARIAAVCTVASVIGGLAGYAIGWGLWETVGRPLIDFYGYADKMEAFAARYNDWGAWIVFTAGITPIPYKVVTITSGFAGYDFLTFVALSIVTRGARFFLEAALLRRYGEPIRAFIERRLKLVTTIVAVVLIGGLVAARYLF